jgi:hypothetical protein
MLGKRLGRTRQGFAITKQGRWVDFLPLPNETNRACRCALPFFHLPSKIARILDSGRKHQAAELTAYLPVAYGHSRDSAGCTIVTIGLPDLISTSRCERSVGSFPSLKYRCCPAKDSWFKVCVELNSWRRGIVLFSVRVTIWRTTGPHTT